MMGGPISKVIKSSDSRIVLHKSANWTGVQADLVHRRDLTRQEIEFLSDRHSIFLNIKGAADCGESFLDGRRVGFVARPEGSLAYIPPGCAWAGWDEGDSNASYLLLSVETIFARNLFDGWRTADLLRPDLGFKDVHIQLAARKIAQELKNLDTASELVVEGQLTTLFGHMLRRCGSTRKLSRGGLSPVVLKRIIEKMEMSVDRKISLSDLSKEAGISAEYFCRAFKRSTGKSPHGYLTSRRLDHASDMLRSTRRSVTEIAFACGFSSGSHLSTSFRREIGVPPIEYRGAWAD